MQVRSCVRCTQTRAAGSPYASHVLSTIPCIRSSYVEMLDICAPKSPVRRPEIRNIRSEPLMSRSGESQDTVVVAHPFAPSCTSSRESTPPAGPENHTSRQSCSEYVAGPGMKYKDRSMSNMVTPTCGEDNDNDNNNSVKLRNSCRSCASSKVRCNKGKPTCSRCEARGIDCQYLQSKRPGRVPGSSLRRLQPNQSADQPRTNNSSAGQAATEANNRSAPASFPPSPTFGLGDCTTDGSHQETDLAFSTSSAGTLDANFFTTPSGGDVDLNVPSYVANAPVAPMGPLSVPSNMEDIVYSSLMDYNTNVVDLNSWWSLDDQGSGLVDPSIADFTKDSSLLPTSNYTSIPASTEPDSLAASSFSSTVHLKDLMETTALFRVSGQECNQSPPPALPELADSGRPESNTPPPCNCMKQALDLLKNLSSAELNILSPSSQESYSQRVLTENKQDIEANLAMLACRACSNDWFLLMILLMIAAKILTRYVSAAASCGPRTPNSSPSLKMSSAMHQDGQATLASDHADRLMEMSRAWGGLCMMLPAPRGGGDAQSSCREAVQRVLRELHRVQRLIAQLAIRRKSLDEHEASMSSAAAALADISTASFGQNNSGSRIGLKRAPSSDSTIGSTATTPFSSSALEMVEEDVRRGLSALSAVIRGLLRNS